MIKSESPELSGSLSSAKSVSPARSVSSERIASVVQKPLSGRGWEYVLEPSPIPASKKCEVQILTSKRKRYTSRMYPMPERYGDGTEEEASETVGEAQSISRYREISAESANGDSRETTSPSNYSPVNVKRTKRKSKKKKARKRLRDERAKAVSYTVDQDTQITANTVEEMQDEPELAGNESKGVAFLSKQNSLLKREVDLLAINYDKKAQYREREIARLQQANIAMCHQLELHKRHTSDQDEDPLGLVAQVAALKKELEDRENEIEQHLKQISYVEGRLYAEKGLNSILEDLQTSNLLSTELSNGFALLETMISRTTAMFTQVIPQSRITHYCNNPMEFPALQRLTRVYFGNRQRTLLHTPKRALPVILFSFIQERIFHAECWKLLHFGGYMVRGYQELIQNIAPPGTIEAFNKASIELMLKEDHQFKDCWIRSRVEDHQAGLLGLLDPLIDPEQFELVGKNLCTSIGRLLTSAFHLRARCVPPFGFCYELLLFKKGDMFDCNYMEAREFDGTAVSVPRVSPSRREKVHICLQGCLLAHPVDSDQDALQVEVPKSPFVCLARQRLDRKLGVTGTLISGKAIVILHRCRHG